MTEIIVLQQSWKMLSFLLVWNHCLVFFKSQILRKKVLFQKEVICRSKYSLANTYCPNLWFPEGLKLFVKEGENSKWLWQTWRQVDKYMLSIEIGWEHIQIGILCGIDMIKHKCRPKCIIIFFWTNKHNCKKITVTHRLFPLTGLVEAWGLCGAWNKKEWVFSNCRRFLLLTKKLAN